MRKGSTGTYVTMHGSSYEFDDDAAQVYTAFTSKYILISMDSDAIVSFRGNVFLSENTTTKK